MFSVLYLGGDEKKKIGCRLIPKWSSFSRVAAAATHLVDQDVKHVAKHGHQQRAN